MTFAAPWVLGGLVLAAVPIILHLIARREPPTVVFPATRYLADATRLHQRRLQLQHLLLLLLRTLLIAALVFAAAGPRWPTAGLGTHAPTAAVIVFDNSLSSGAIQAGVPVLDGLKAAAGQVLDRATADDRLWLVTADGIPRQASVGAHRSRIDTAGPSTRRLDLGAAVRAAAEILESQELQSEIIVISDLQRTALGQSHDGPMTVLRPASPPPANAGLGSLTLGSQPWGPDGGTAAISVVGVGEGARPVTFSVPGRPDRQLLVPVGGQGGLRVSGLLPGWWKLSATLDPDELRTDDGRSVAVRVAPAARVSWSAEDHYVATAAEVLVQNGRIARGAEVSLGTLGTSAAAVVLPPADPARIGALNRELAARGSSWRFGDPSIAPVTTDSGPWLGRERISRRHRLTFQGGAPTDVLITAGGEPWLVRSGRIVLVGSRFDPEWTALPLSAGFLPFIDALVNRAARGELVQLSAAPGDRVMVPDRVTAVAVGERTAPVEGGSAFVPSELGPHFLLADRDTIGSLSVNPDPRESDLVRASDDEIASLWPKARIGNLERAPEMAFQASATSDLRGPFLWLAAILGLLEIGLASFRRSRG